MFMPKHQIVLTIGLLITLLLARLDVSNASNFYVPDTYEFAYASLPDEFQCWDELGTPCQTTPDPTETPTPTPTTIPYPSKTATSPSHITGAKKYTPEENYAIAQAECERQGLDPAIGHAVLTQESHHNNLAYSSGNYGMWQINLPSHPNITPEQAYDPYWSSQWAVAHLKGLIDSHGLENGLAAYNAGTGGMKQGKGFGYAKEVLAKMGK